MAAWDERPSHGRGWGFGLMNDEPSTMVVVEYKASYNRPSVDLLGGPDFGERPRLRSPA